VGEKGVILEYVADASATSRNGNLIRRREEVLSIQRNTPPVRLLQSGNTVQNGALARTGWAEQHQKTSPELEGNINGNSGKNLMDIHFQHGWFLLSSKPAAFCGSTN